MGWVSEIRWRGRRAAGGRPPSARVAKTAPATAMPAVPAPARNSRRDDASFGVATGASASEAARDEPATPGPAAPRGVPATPASLMCGPSGISQSARPRRVVPASRSAQISHRRGKRLAPRPRATLLGSRGGAPANPTTIKEIVRTKAAWRSWARRELEPQRGLAFGRRTAAVISGRSRSGRSVEDSRGDDGGDHQCDHAEQAS